MAENAKVASVVEAIGRQIAAGTYPPGATLPVEADLAASLDVGRTSVREAVKVLSGKGLLETRRRAGTCVRPVADWNLFDPDVVAWAMAGAGSRKWIEDLTEVRRLIEPAAAALAAERASRREAADLLAAAEAMRSATGDDEESLDADLHFHRSLAECSHNALLASFSHALSALLRVEFALAMETSGGYEANLALHEAVAEAVAARQPGAAEDAARRLIDANRRDLGSLLDP